MGLEVLVPYVDDVAVMAAKDPNVRGAIGLGSGNAAPNVPAPKKLGKAKLPGGKAGAAVANQGDDAAKAAAGAAEEGIEDKIIQYGNFGAIGLDLGPMLVGGGIGAVGGLVGSSTIKGAGQKVSSIRNITFNQIGERIPGSGIIGTINGGMMKVAGAGADLMGALGINSLMSKWHGRNLESQTQKFMGHAEEVFAHPHANTREMSGVLSDLKTAMSGPAHAIDIDKFDSALSAARNEAAKHNSSLVGKLDALGKSTNKMWKSAYQSEGWKNLGDNTRAAAKNMGNAKIGHGLMNAAFIAGALVDDYHTIRDLNRGIKSLRTMYANLTHTKEEDVSTFTLLAGSVPKTVAAARGELFKEFGPASVLSAANTVINVKWAAHHKLGSMLAVIAVPLLNQLVVRGFMGGSILPTYMKLKTAEKNGQPLSREDYAHAVGEFSEDIRKRGGADSNFAKALGEVYAEQRMSVDKVLAEAEDGTMMKRLEKLQKQADALRSQLKKEGVDEGAFKQQVLAKKGYEPEPAAQPAQQAQGDHAHTAHAHAEPSHVDRLKNSAPAGKEKAVIGKHTEMLHRSSQDRDVNHAHPHLSA